jgi:hypothetical protein
LWRGSRVGFVFFVVLTCIGDIVAPNGTYYRLASPIVAGVIVRAAVSLLRWSRFRSAASPERRP